jgi:hypothetical protein
LAKVRVPTVDRWRFEFIHQGSSALAFVMQKLPADLVKALAIVATACGVYSGHRLGQL